MFCSQRGDCGYDYEFTDNVPDTLLCIVCHLVLRDPVQIMKCGHRFCTPCFERMKSYSKRMKADLTCPIDRAVVDLSKVFKDTAVSRDVGNLKVKCENSTCSWGGEVRYLQEHQETCEDKQDASKKKTDVEAETTSKLLAQVFLRLNKCEEELQKKEKEICALKMSIQEQSPIISQVSRLKLSKVTNVSQTSNADMDMKEEIQLLKEINIAYESDINALKISHLEMEKELKTLKKKNHQCKEDIFSLTIENSKQKKEITDTKNKLDGLIEQNLVTRGITKISNNDRKTKSKDEPPRSQKYDLGIIDEWGRRIKPFRR